MFPKLWKPIAAMSMSKVFSVCLAAGCFAAASGSPVLANLIANGDCEAATDGKLDSWNCHPVAKGAPVARLSEAPAVLAGTRSARILHGPKSGGL